MNRRLGLLVAVAQLLFLPRSAFATQFTVTDTFDWFGSTNSSGVTYQEFTEPNLPAWSHPLTFVPPAASFDSAEVELSFGGTRSTAQEVWFLYDSSVAVLLGQLTSTGNNSANTIVHQTFTVPASLYPAFAAGSWTLMLRITEPDSSTQSIFMDYSKLTVKYQGDEQTPPPLPGVPEPATLLLLGTGLGLAGLYRRRQSRRV